MISLLFLILWWVVLFLPWRNKSVVYRPWYSMLLVLLLCAAAVTISDYYHAFYPQKIIMRDTTVYLGPDVSYGIRGEVKAGDKVIAGNIHNNWCKITSTIITGWIQCECLKPEDV